MVNELHVYCSQCSVELIMISCRKLIHLAHSTQ